MAGDTATFGIKLTGDPAGANDAAAALEQVRRRVDEGNEALKAMSASYRALRGSTEEVKKAKDDLKSKISAEKDSLSSANLVLLKQGKSYTDLTKSAKLGASERTKAEADAAKKAKDDATKLKESQKESAKAFADNMKQREEVLAGVTAAALTLTAAVVGGGIAFGRFVIESANALRSAGLLREAFAGGADNGKALGEQLDVLARKVKTPKADLQALSQSLIEAGLSGQTLVDALNATGQAGAAGLGKLKSLIESTLKGGVLAGGREGIVALRPSQLFGTGLEWADVTRALADRMHTSIAAADAALQSGRVKLADAAAALRGATESKFGKLNLLQMLDLDVLKQKAGEALTSLTKNVKLEPLLEGMQKFFGLLDTTTVSGHALRGLIGDIGNTLVDAFAKGVPVAIEFVERLILGALRLQGEYYKVRNAVLIAFRDDEILHGIKGIAEGIDGIGVAGQVADGYTGQLASSLKIVSAELSGSYAIISAIPRAFLAFSAAAQGAWAALKAIPWSEIGTAVVTGIVDGLKSAEALLTGEIKGLGNKIKEIFKDALGIHSPSAVFAEYGEQTAAGYGEGVEAGTPKAHRAVRELGGAAPTGGGGASRVEQHLHLTIHVPTEAAANAIRTDESFMAKLLKGVEEINVMAGIPVQAEAT